MAIRQELPETGVLVLSQYVEERYAVDLLAAGDHVQHLLLAGVLLPAGEDLLGDLHVREFGKRLLEALVPSQKAEAPAAPPVAAAAPRIERFGAVRRRWDPQRHTAATVLLECGECGS